MSIYEDLGLRPVINARGNQTVLGGSSTSAEVLEAMAAANDQYVVMEELLGRSGDVVAGLLGVEAAYVTSGCAAALALAVAACIAGKDPDKVGRLPDTTGMKNEVVFQRVQRYNYERVYTIPGGRLALAGNGSACTREQLEAAFGANTAALAYYMRPDWGPEVVSLQDAVSIAHTKGVPAVVDAAAQIFPLGYFRGVAQAADLVCFGAKYFGAPHSTGILCGKRDLVEAAAAQGFIGFETVTGPRPLGRAFKVDRQEVVAVVVALRHWFSMNHEDRLQVIESRLRVLERELGEVEGIKTKREPNFPAPLTGVRIPVGAERAALVAGELDRGEPRIWVRVEGGDVVAHVHTLAEGEVTVLARRLRETLTT